MKEESAFPIVGAGSGVEIGLTKREYFAARALQGILAGTGLTKVALAALAKDQTSHAEYIAASLAISDSLMNALEAQKVDVTRRTAILTHDREGGREK